MSANVTDTKKPALVDQITVALATYESNRATLLQNAFDNGGAAKAKELETEYNALQAAFFELQQRALVANAANYEAVMDEAINVTRAINDSINSLKNITNVINNITSTVNLVGRIVLLFGA
jgi:hypothetical protein